MLIRGLVISAANTIIEEAFLNTTYIVSISKDTEYYKEYNDYYEVTMINGKKYYITKADFNKLVRSEYNGQ